jgi:catechol 2,3-dioxygenase-like lactoylglutathione lyase family enzyme
MARRASLPKLIYTGVEVSDFDRSLRFYRDVLRMKCLFVTPIKETGGKVAWFRSPGGDQTFEINWYPERDWAPGSSLDHLGFMVEDAAAWQKRIAGGGGREAPDAAVDAENMVLRFAFDPDGVPLELIEPKKKRGPKAPKFIYTGIRVTDLQASAKWYAEVMAMKNQGEGFAEWTGGRTVGLVSPGGKQQLELNWYPGSYAEAFRRGGSELDHLCFEVDDCDSWFVKLGAMGHKQLIMPFDEGSWRLAYVEGPDGECLEIGHRIKKPKPVLKRPKAVSRKSRSSKKRRS